MKVYVVTSHRFGDTEKHSYVVGVFDDVQIANLACEVEQVWRGGKYECSTRQMDVESEVEPEKVKAYLDTL